MASTTRNLSLKKICIQFLALCCNFFESAPLSRPLEAAASAAARHCRQCHWIFRNSFSFTVTLTRKHECGLTNDGQLRSESQLPAPRSPLLPRSKPLPKSCFCSEQCSRHQPRVFAWLKEVESLQPVCAVITNTAATLSNFKVMVTVGTSHPALQLR